MQLNFKIGRDKTPDFNLLKQRMKTYGSDRRIILSYNPENKEFINRLYQEGFNNFDVLYDSSHGEGKSAEKWEAPAFNDIQILQGYAGGLSAENVSEALTEIAKVVPQKQFYAIDAEGKLKDSDGHLSIEKCALYVGNALAWQENKEARI